MSRFSDAKAVDIQTADFKMADIQTADAKTTTTTTADVQADMAGAPMAWEQAIAQFDAVARSVSTQDKTLFALWQSTYAQLHEIHWPAPPAPPATPAPADYHGISARFSDWPTAMQQQLCGLCTASPFLLATLIQQPHLVGAWLGITAPIQAHQDPLAQYADALHTLAETDAMRLLRQHRNAALGQILCDDMRQQQSVAASLARISALADHLINSAYRYAWQQLQSSWGQPLDEQGQPMPLLIMGMGKLGGHELNFSSDIDLIFVFPEHGDTQGGRRSCDHQQFYTRLGQKIITLLHQVTADGFVYRVDMRLRPFGDSGPLVVSLAALEDYYQAQGRDWERYAMVKARVLNPDSIYTPQLQHILRPYIYRRYIDYSAIESLRRMKQLIEQENRRRNRIQNIKLGSGGIREVEFIVQTLQLIRGGRMPQLQTQSILTAMQVIADEGIWPAAQMQQLRDDYLLLRQVEHALQGMADQQTQTLPQDAAAQYRLALLLWPLSDGDYTKLEHAISVVMQRIHHEFQQVIAQEASAEPSELSVGTLVWDSELEPALLAEQLEWLSESDGCRFISLLHEFRAESQRKTMGPRGRELLGRLVPLLCNIMAKRHADAEVLASVLGVLRQIVSRTAYLELLFENPPALDQLVHLCQRSRYLAADLARYPMLLDELIDPAQLYQVAHETDYRDRLTQLLLRVLPDDLEGQMETLRHYKQSQQLKIAAADITGVLPLMKVSDHLTWLAEAIMAAVVDMAWQQMVDKYGYPAGTSAGSGKAFAVIAYGKLGGLELGYGSDLDLVFLHQCESMAPTSGDKAIDSRQFYLKLVQRILHICTTKTSSGLLYDVDTRLRPSGNAGLLTVHVDTYAEYLAKEAWTWEHQALVRTRLIYGDSAISERFLQVRQQTLAKPRDIAALRQAVLDMRQKLREHHGLDNQDVKHCAGGIVDLEFISQFLVLAYADRCSGLYQFSDNIRILEAAAAAQLLPVSEADALAEAYRLLRGVSHRRTLQPNVPVQHVVHAPATISNSHEVDENLLTSAVADAIRQVQTSWQRIMCGS